MGHPCSFQVFRINSVLQRKIENIFQGGEEYIKSFLSTFEYIRSYPGLLPAFKRLKPLLVHRQ